MTMSDKNAYRYIRNYSGEMLIKCDCDRNIDPVRLTKTQYRHTCPLCGTEFSLRLSLDVVPPVRRDWSALVKDVDGKPPFEVPW